MSTYFFAIIASITAEVLKPIIKSDSLIRFSAVPPFCKLIFFGNFFLLSVSISLLPKLTLPLKMKLISEFFFANLIIIFVTSLLNKPQSNCL